MLLSSIHEQKGTQWYENPSKYIKWLNLDIIPYHVLVYSVSSCGWLLIVIYLLLKDNELLKWLIAS